MRAVRNGATLAESNGTISVEGNHYFPPTAVNCEYLKVSDTHTTCSWKGEASYYHIVANGQENRDAVRFYPSPQDAAGNIKNYVAFWPTAMCLVW